MYNDNTSPRDRLTRSRSSSSTSHKPGRYWHLVSWFLLYLVVALIVTLIWQAYMSLYVTNRQEVMHLYTSSQLATQHVPSWHIETKLITNN